VDRFARFYLVSAGALETDASDMLLRAMPPDGSVRIDKMSTQCSALGLDAILIAGRTPQSRVATKHSPTPANRKLSQKTAIACPRAHR
jgi:hypothetical protein